ncbi:MAG: site-specific DNA-methyltransferase [Patescibacteria group bacterium]|nr:site-specific DNA-methyltransferase [Patescibacteria group bacterium]
MNRVYLGSCEKMTEIPDASVHCCVTSPPYYGLREYEADGQIGHEATVAEYVDRLVGVFREVRRVLRPDGTAWLNIGDSYAGSWGAQGRTVGDTGSKSKYDKRLSERTISARQIVTHPRRTSGTGTIRDEGLKPKDLIGVPWRVAFALQADGWWLRDAIVWAKPNPMPSSVTDRCTSSYEMIFMLAKSRRYFADMDAVREPMAEASVARLEQARLEQQAGSMRANGGAKTNGPMKAVARRNPNAKGLKQAPQLEDNPLAYNMAGANLRNVWTIATTPFSGDHPAVMPRMLAQRCILIGSPPGGIVLDPFMGSGTVAEVAIGCGREYVGYELNPDYHKVIADRLGLFGKTA